MRRSSRGSRTRSTRSRSSETVASQAEKRLTTLGYINVHVRSGDGYRGWPEQAPFDAILVSAAPQKIPKPLLDQLRVGGKMVVAQGGFFQDLLVITKTADGLEKRTIIPVRLSPMTGRIREAGPMRRLAGCSSPPWPWERPSPSRPSWPPWLLPPPPRRPGHPPAGRPLRRPAAPMVEEQVRSRDVKDTAVLGAVEEVPRHLFVPAEERGRAYADQPLPIGRRPDDLPALHGGADDLSSWS